ncbi:methyltransferase domain-containing protein [Arenibacter sp. 6A1]|uniref:methyltransferase domain-containing protein n=1 Tax=Arenibacter sp. 6A1 TaxID=2720391 RepID=UPI001F0EC060|nr:methyltransferase domain-containing protein [Arenibacter sp. 6A1]
MNFDTRSSEIEMMDDPSVDLGSLQEILFDINRVNVILNGYTITLKAIKKIIHENPKNSYTIIDMGCGDGTMLRKVVRYFKNEPFKLNLIGIDLSENGIEIAKAMSTSFPNISYQNRDILSLEAHEIDCDIVLSTLTMHHFSSQEIPLFLDQFVKVARLGVIINDLQRSKLAYGLFWIFSLIFIKTKVGKSDGLVSIKRGFVLSDLMAFSQNIPNVLHTIKWKWAFRYLWVLRTKTAEGYE